MLFCVSSSLQEHNSPIQVLVMSYVGEFLRVLRRTGGATSIFFDTAYIPYFGGFLCCLIDAREPKTGEQPHHPSAQSTIVRLCSRLSRVFAAVQMALDERVLLGT